jgi:hypothetical protein
MHIRSRWRETTAGVAVLVAVVFLPVSASAGQARALVKKQRIAIEERIAPAAQSGTFRLIPLTPGAVKADSGTLTYTAQQLPTVMPDGQRTARYKGIDTLSGKRGTLRISNATASTDAGGGYSVGTGTWSLGHGTNKYTGLIGNGRASVAGTPSGLIITRYEGYVAEH